jgi:hypothetical protein
MCEIHMSSWSNPIVILKIGKTEEKSVDDV